MILRAHLLAWLLSFLFAVPNLALAAPQRTQMGSQKILVQVKRNKGNSFILKDGFKAVIRSPNLQWEYIPNTSVSVPFIDLQFVGIPVPNNFTILAERSGTLNSDPTKGYLLHLPLLRVDNSILITVVDQAGHFEDWKVTVSLGLVESAVFVDESCRDYSFKVREVRRPTGPSLIYLGCRPGSGPKELSMDLLWGDMKKIEYRGQQIKAESSVVTVPLESKKATVSEVVGLSNFGERNVYEIEYQPYLPPPYEIWLGLSYFYSSFTQSSFDARYDQLGTAAFTQILYRPDDVRLSVLGRGFMTVHSFQQALTPSQGYAENAASWFFNLELRLSVLDRSGWRIDPFIGGWFFFQEVASRNFGIQRVIDPLFGVYLHKMVSSKDTLALTLRWTPLQTFFNPLDLFSQAYKEAELTFTHSLKQRQKVFASFFVGALNFQPPDSALTLGSYFVFSGGYGW